MNAGLKACTISDFGDQWTTYREDSGAYGDKETRADTLGLLLSLDAVKGARVCDIGSGLGRIVNMLLDSGAPHSWSVVGTRPEAKS